MEKSLYKCLLWVPLLAVLVMGCKREEEPPVDHSEHQVHTVDLRLKLVFKHGTHDYELASEYTNDLGQLYKLDTVRFLLSGFDVIDDGSVVQAAYNDLELLVDASQNNDHALGQLTAAHAHQIRFLMGLSANLNGSDPASAAPPLDDETMHWGPGSDEGYWFLMITGRVDSDGSGVIEATDQAFTYKCGTDALARSGWAVMHLDIPDGGTMTVEAAVDIARLIDHLDLLANPSAIGGTSLNVQLMDSLQAIFHESH